jgi:hypothetical protein
MSGYIEYIYLLQEREFIKTKEEIYKIGRISKNNLIRFNQYPKDSELIIQIKCKDSKNEEKELIIKFKDKFKQRKDIGNEYFEGDYNLMIDIIYNNIKSNITINETINEEKILDDKNDKIYKEMLYERCEYYEKKRMSTMKLYKDSI